MSSTGGEKKRTITGNPKILIKGAEFVYNADEFQSPFRELSNMRLVKTPSYKLLEASLKDIRSSKRDFSGSSIDSISDVKGQAKRNNFKNVTEYQNWANKKAIVHLKGQMKVIDSHLEAMRIGLEILKEAESAGVMKPKELQEEREHVEAQYLTAENLLLLMYRNLFKIGGELTDALKNFGEEAVPSNAYLDSILANTGITPRNATKHFSLDRHEKKRILGDFTQANRKFLNTEHPNNANTQGEHSQLWCPITKKYWSTKYMKTSHLVPQNLGYTQAEYILGPSGTDNGHIYDPRNGIPMVAILEKGFDRGAFIIVPAGDQPNELQLVILDKDWAKEQGAGGIWNNHDFNKLWDDDQPHERILQFKHATNRPRHRYLYYAMLLTILRRQRHQVPGWQRDVAKYVGKTMWGSPQDGYIRNSIMGVLARRIGHIPDLQTFCGSYASQIPTFWDDGTQKEEEEENAIADESHASSVEKNPA